MKNDGYYDIFNEIENLKIVVKQHLIYTNDSLFAIHVTLDEMAGLLQSIYDTVRIDGGGGDEPWNE